MYTPRATRDIEKRISLPFETDITYVYPDLTESYSVFLFRDRVTYSAAE